MKRVKGGKKGERERERYGLGYMCISWRELWEGGIDGQMGRVGEKERGMDCSEGKTKELCRGRKRNGLAGGQQEKGCEGRRGRQIWQVCGVEIDGLSVRERRVSARYCSNR